MSEKIKKSWKWNVREYFNTFYNGRGGAVPTPPVYRNPLHSPPHPREDLLHRFPPSFHSIKSEVWRPYSEVRKRVAQWADQKKEWNCVLLSSSISSSLILPPSALFQPIVNCSIPRRSVLAFLMAAQADALLRGNLNVTENGYGRGERVGHNWTNPQPSPSLKENGKGGMPCMYTTV